MPTRHSKADTQTTHISKRNEQHIALANQAREIRLCARALEEIAQTDKSLDNPTSIARVAISRKLGEIQSTLDALMARFARADR